jgi:hypothetical protein
MAFLTIASVVILASSIAISIHEYKCNRILARKAKREQNLPYKTLEEALQKIKEDLEKKRKEDSLGLEPFDLEVYNRMRREPWSA